VPVAVLHFDSHPDTWDSYRGERYTHGTLSDARSSKA
jgi:agmatinase